MTKTIEQMVQELDARFEGLFSKAIESTTSVGYGGNFRIWIIVYSHCCEIQMWKTCDKTFMAIQKNSLEEAITKAHDYFIVKGGEL